MNVASFAPQLAAWMVVSLVLSAALSATAVLLHRLARGAFPTRLVWSVALGATVTLIATQPLRRAANPHSLAVVPAAVITPLIAEEPRTGWSRVDLLAERAGSAVQQQLRALASETAASVRSWPVLAQWGLLMVWPLTSLGVLLMGGWSYRRQRQAVRGATVTILDGYTVHVTPNIGPAVFGTHRPSIVVPAWLLERPADEQRLVIQHEQAHIAAHDPLLLLSGCLAVAAFPWNPAMWYLLSRLRLAIELDCDARVLAAGASTRRYGELLIDLSAASPPLPLFTGAPAFSHRATHLERRIRNMTHRPGSLRTPRRLVALAISAGALFAACGAELPTSAQLEGMDVAAAQQRAATLSSPSTQTEFVVDGKASSETAARAIAAERIATINISQKSRNTNVIAITTRDASGKIEGKELIGTNVNGTMDGLTFRADSLSARKAVAIRIAGKGADTSRSITMNGSVRTSSATSFEGLILVDGVKSTAAEMNKLSPTKIASVEIIKGATAEALYGAEGSKGVIKITTKQ